jgi:hypothetical protein
MVRPAPWFCVLAVARISSMTVVAGRCWARVAAWSFAGLALLTLIAALVLLVLNGRAMGGGGVVSYGISAVAVVVYVWVGGLIAARIRGNAIGWLLCLTGLSLAVSLFSEQYALRALATAPGSCPLPGRSGRLRGARSCWRSYC